MPGKRCTYNMVMICCILHMWLKQIFGRLVVIWTSTKRTCLTKWRLRKNFISFDQWIALIIYWFTKGSYILIEISQSGLQSLERYIDTNCLEVYMAFSEWEDLPRWFSFAHVDIINYYVYPFDALSDQQFSNDIKPFHAQG